MTAYERLRKFFGFKVLTPTERTNAKIMKDMDEYFITLEPRNAGKFTYTREPSKYERYQKGLYYNGKKY